MRSETATFWNLAEPYVGDAGFDLIEVQWNREPGGWILRLFIDRPEGNPLAATPVSHQDCERVSRDLSAALDASDRVPHAYQLEVSSPGLDRPLRRQQDFSRFSGQEARVRLNDPVEGRRNFTGKLIAARDGFVEMDCDGRRYQLPIDGVAKANLVPDWDQEFHRSAS